LAGQRAQVASEKAPCWRLVEADKVSEGMAKKKATPQKLQTAPQPSKELRAEWMFRSAAGFEWTHRLTSKDIQTRSRKKGKFKAEAWEDQSFVDIGAEWLPSMVNGILAVEIYFKCIQMLDTGSFSAIHKVDLLFNALGLQRQRRIEVLYNERLGKRKTIPMPDKTTLDVSLKNMLKAQSNLFIEGRYWFDFDDNERTWETAAPTAIAEATRLTILEIMPQWEQILSTFH
jgi:hypothetical protein